MIPEPFDARLLMLVVRHHRRFGYGATVRELCDELCWASPATVHEELKRLRRAGFVTWEDGKARTLRPLVVEVPMRAAS